MQKILSAEEMRQIDRLTTEKYGIPSIILMENAAHAAARVIAEKLGGSVAGKTFLILCGKGNNGGDGAALARILETQGAKVFTNLFASIENTKGDAHVNHTILRTGRDIDIFQWNWFEYGEFEDFKEWKKVFTMYFRTNKIDAIIDAYFGTGLSKPIRGIAAEAVKFFSNIKDEAGAKEILFVSIDLPSGLNADSGEQIGETFRSDLTVTFTAPKLANVLPPASNFGGELIAANIGSPRELIDASPSQTFLAEKSDALDWLETTEFTDNSYKNKRGHALLVVGSRNYAGAGVLAGNAAMISGVGLATIATSESAQNSIAARAFAEIMVRGFAETKKGALAEKAFAEIDEFIAQSIDAVAVGSGLSSNEATTRKLVAKLVEKRRTPLVLDADGLNALAPFEIEGSDEFPLVLTPHEGEFLKLLGTKDKDALKNRVEAARDFAVKHKVILVLKGERTLTAAPDRRVVVNPTGNSGLGKAGNGDTLTGIITGFMTQTLKTDKEYTFYTPYADEKAKTYEIFSAVVAAVYLAGLAGDIAARKFGRRAMLASDVRACLGEAVQSIKS